MATLNNWKASAKPQQKSKKTPRKYQQWITAFNLMRQRLKEGINLPSFLVKIFVVEKQNYRKYTF